MWRIRIRSDRYLRTSSAGDLPPGSTPFGSVTSDSENHRGPDAAVLARVVLGVPRVSPPS